MPKMKLFISGICLLAGLYFIFLCASMFNDFGVGLFGLYSFYFLSVAIMGNLSVPFFYFYNKNYVLPVFVLTLVMTLTGIFTQTPLAIHAIELVGLVQTATLGAYLLSKVRPIAKTLSH